VAQIISADSFSPSTLGAPGTFVVIEPPPPIAVGPSTNVGGIVGTAPWGPLNTPVSMGGQNDASTAFGLITAAALTDAHDMPTDLSLAFTQAQATGVSIDLWGVRVSDGTDVAASVILKDTTTPTAATGGTLTALYTGSMGNSIQVAIYAGSLANTASVKLIGFTGAQVEVYPNLPAPTISGAFWTALESALANGVSGVRGPSQLARFTPASSVTSPAIGTFALAGGTDGRTSVTTAQLTGQNATFPYTGAYALQALVPAVTAFWIVGLSDNTAYANMAALAQSMSAAFAITFPTGTATSVAVTDLAGYALSSNYDVFAFKDWIYFQDTANNVTRLVPPFAVAMGRILTLSPSVSPLNKPAYGIVGTERNNPLSGVNTPYSYPELSQLQAAGIMVIGNPSPGGNYFGFLTGVNVCSNTVQSPVEWTRTTNYLAGWISKNSGQFIGQNQSPLPDDPLRASVRATFNSGIGILIGGGIVAAGSIQCDSSNNTEPTVAAHQLYAYFVFTYLSSVWYFVAQITGGTTVVTSGSTLGAALGGLT
jgi:Bacteriophage tail sheath protein